MILTETKFRAVEQLIDDVVVPSDAVIDEIAVSISAFDEQGRGFTLSNGCRKLDIDMRAVVEGAKRLPGRIVAADRIAEMQIVRRKARLYRRDLRRGDSGGVVAASAGHRVGADCLPCPHPHRSARRQIKVFDWYSRRL